MAPTSANSAGPGSIPSSKTFRKDLPIARVGADVLIAYEMNGSALPAEHGFPASSFPGSTEPTA
jgi:DMSO/TMAO reductase YedYZ molybdopterin-dependent catalytic subunit